MSVVELLSSKMEEIDMAVLSQMEETDMDDVIIVSLLCEEEEQEQAKKKRRIWVHDIPKSRYEEGEYHTLLPRLKRHRKRFHTYFRMSQHKFENLLQTLKPHIEKQDTLFRKAIGVEEKLMVTIRFLATGDSFKTIAESFRLGYTTVQEIVHTTCVALWNVLSKIVMQIPDEEKWKKIEKAFCYKWNYPNCIGALDGKHIEIFSPPKSGLLYFNYKKFFSIVLLALVDADYKFIYVNVGELGKNSDAGIFSRSDLRAKLESNTLNIPGLKELPGTRNKLPHVIVGDEAFPLKTYLMRPYPGTQLDDQSKKVYNYRHSRARRVSENAFGILSQKFRIFYRNICLIPEHVDYVILATCVLHNYLRNDSVSFDNEDTEETQLQDLPRIGGNFVNNAIQVRDKFKHYFNSPQGSLAWQNDMVNRGCISRQRENE